MEGRYDRNLEFDIGEVLEVVDVEHDWCNAAARARVASPFWEVVAMLETVCVRHRHFQILLQVQGFSRELTMAQLAYLPLLHQHDLSHTSLFGVRSIRAAIITY